MRPQTTNKTQINPTKHTQPRKTGPQLTSGGDCKSETADWNESSSLQDKKLRSSTVDTSVPCPWPY